MAPPPPRARICGSTAWMPLKAPVRLTASTRSQSSVVISAIIRRTVVPAPLTRMSMPPQASVMPSVNLAKASRSATSIACDAAWSLRLVISAATASAAAASRSRTATRAPAAVKARQVAAPIPLPPPVTRATFPVKSSAIASTPSLQVVEQRLRLFQIGRSETFSEPAIDRREEVAGFGMAALVAAQPRKARGGAQFPELGLLLSGDAQRFAIQLFGGLGIALAQQQFAFVPMELCLQPALRCPLADLERFVQFA